MATQDDTQDDLTLELDGRVVTPEDFLKGVRAFFAAVKAVTAEACVDEERVRWNVRVLSGSNLVGVRPSPGQRIAPGTMDDIETMLESGLMSVARSEDLSRYPRKLLVSLKTLGGIVNADDFKGTTARVWVRKKPFPMSTETARRAAEHLTGHYEEHGSIEGHLRVVSERGNRHVEIDEVLTGAAIRCYLDDDDLQEQALGAFGCRVAVYGMVRYRADGTPINIAVDEIEQFPANDDLPSFQSVHGILRDIEWREI